MRFENAIAIGQPLAPDREIASFIAQAAHKALICVNSKEINPA
jgi:hypothetical protein